MVKQIFDELWIDKTYFVFCIFKIGLALETPYINQKERRREQIASLLISYIYIKSFQQLENKKGRFYRNIQPFIYV